MLTPANLILPLLLVALTGFMAGRIGLFSQEHIRGLSRFVVSVGVPALMVTSLSKQPLHSVFELQFLLMYLGVMLSCGALALLMGRLIIRNNTGAQQATLFLSVVVPNSIIIGYPIVLQAFGEASIGLFLMIMLAENVVLIPLALVLFEVSQLNTHHEGFSKALAKRVLGNPIVISMIVGITLSLLEWHPPGIVDTALATLAKTVSGLALFVVGALMANATLSDFSGRTLGAVTIRMLIAPGLALLLTVALPPLSPMATAALLIFSASPSFTLLPAIAQQYGEGQMGTGIQTLATAVSLVTLPIVLWLALH
jgi:hypothetical protein